MSYKLYFLIFLCFCSLISIQAQNLPVAYTTDFSNTGYKGTIPSPSLIIDITGSPYNADNTGATDCSAKITAAITAAGSSGVVYFPAGTYRIQSTIKLKPGVILRGAGSDKTSLHFDITGASNLIEMKGSPVGSNLSLSANAFRGSSTVVLTSVSGLAAGSTIYLYQDPGLLAWDNWASTNNFMQVVHIKSISGNTVTLEEPLRFDFIMARNAFVKRINAIKESGIEDVKIVCLNKSYHGDTPQNDNIAIDYADNCWVVGIEGERCNGAHIDLRRSANIQISGCYFHHAHGYGGGGAGYGVCLTGGASQVMVANTIFDSLRHAMVVQAFSNGNIFAYNYSARVHRTDFEPYDKPGDVVLHGNYPSGNLFQGNIANYMVIDNPHGANGPRNIFLRNRFTRYGILIDKPRTDAVSQAQQAAGIQNDSTVLIANEITHATGSGYGAYSIFSESKGNFQLANLKQGSITPSGTSASDYKTFYNQKKPLFWDIPDSWHGIGDAYNTTGIPAKARYENTGAKQTDSRKLLFDLSPLEQSTMPTVQDVTYCIGDLASPLHAVGINLRWYSSPAGVSGSTIAPTPSTSNAGETMYYVTQTEDGKTESEKAVITVTVDDCSNPDPDPTETVISKENISIEIHKYTHSFSINLNGKGRVQVYTFEGQLVVDQKITQTGTAIYTVPVSTGFCIIYATTNDGRKASFKVWL
jgi:hypothetical protein